MAVDCQSAQSSSDPAEEQRPSDRGRLAVPWADVLIITAATIAALALRALLAARSGLWRDETQFLVVVRAASMAEMLGFVHWHEWHPPLFYVLMRGWLGIAGDSTAAALSLPILFGAFQVPAAYLVGARMFSRHAGLVAAGLVAVTPWLAGYSAEVRPYSLLPLLVLTASFFLWRGLADGGLGPWLGYGVTTLLMLLTHHWCWLVLGAEWAVVGLFLAAPGGRPVRSVLRDWLLAQCGILLAYGPCWPILLYQVRHGGHAAQALPFVARAAVLVLVGLFGALLWRALHRPRDRTREAYLERLALGICLGIPLLALAAAALLSARSGLLLGKCAAMLAPNILVALAHGLVAAPSLARPIRRRIAIASLLATFLGLTVASLGEVKSNARELAASVAGAARPDDLIVIAPAMVASSFNYYYKADNPQVDYPYSGRKEAVPWDDLLEHSADAEALQRAKMELDQAHADGRRVWFVTLQDYQTDNVDDDETLPAWADSTPAVVCARTNQLRRHLLALYGVPADTVAPGRPVEGTELLRATLFAPRSTAFAGETER
jgi:hypothetical protein